MAFHLGCLRALHTAGLLDRVSTISSVSGGSVLAALYCSTQGDFAAFESRVRTVLAKGFVLPSLKVSVTSAEGLSALVCFALLGLDRTAASVARVLSKAIPKSRRSKWQWLRESPIRRWASRTTILRNAFQELFDGILLGDLRDDRPKLIIVACDLSARSAFYFAKDGVGSWRRGSAPGERVSVAHAVAASAAFPALLPALDQKMKLTRNGVTTEQRVILTDGGVYDNLGLAPLWPGRVPEISLHVERYDRLIACRAGYGSRLSPASAFWPSRMLAVIDSIHARAQNAATQRLFDFEKAKELKAVLLPYLDQKDADLGELPDGFVTAGEVADYPTDFSAMPEEWIDRLSKRGEQVTRMLLREYWNSDPRLG
jgi:NTE family protein